jgi:hypothetical protein
MIGETCNVMYPIEIYRSMVTLCWQILWNEASPFRSCCQNALPNVGYHVAFCITEPSETFAICSMPGCTDGVMWNGPLWGHKRRIDRLWFMEAGELINVDNGPSGYQNVLLEKPAAWCDIWNYHAEEAYKPTRMFWCGVSLRLQRPAGSDCTNGRFIGLSRRVLRQRDTFHRFG